jgi:hypothetical protein
LTPAFAGIVDALILETVEVELGAIDAPAGLDLVAQRRA